MENFNADEARKLSAKIIVLSFLDRIKSEATKGNSFMKAYESIPIKVIEELKVKGFKVDLPTPEMMVLDNKAIQIISW